MEIEIDEPVQDPNVMPYEKLMRLISQGGRLYSKLLENPNKVPIVLISSGSFAPPHKMHIKMFEKAREHLESIGEIVIAGYLCPSSDSYVYSKLKDDAITLWKRNEMCRIATKDSDWMDVVPWGYASGDRTQWLIFRKIGELFEQKEICKGKVNCLQMYGADTVLRIGNLKWFSEIVVLGRPGYTQKLQQAIAETEKEDKSWKSPFIIVPNELEGLSSTAVRKAMKEGDRDKLLEMLNPEVVDFLLKDFAEKIKFNNQKW